PRSVRDAAGEGDRYLGELLVVDAVEGQPTARVRELLRATRDARAAGEADLARAASRYARLRGARDELDRSRAALEHGIPVEGEARRALEDSSCGTREGASPEHVAATPGRRTARGVRAGELTRTAAGVRGSEVMAPRRKGDRRKSRRRGDGRER